jgi:hypothetical protein
MSLDADSDCVVVRLYEFDYTLTPEGEAALRHKEGVAAEARELARERKDAQINGAPLSLV